MTQPFSVFTMADIYRSRGLWCDRPVYATTDNGTIKCMACDRLIGRTLAARHFHEHSQGHVENLMRYVCEAK